jgi:hypothetical protein
MRPFAEVRAWIQHRFTATTVTGVPAATV